MQNLRTLKMYRWVNPLGGGDNEPEYVQEEDLSEDELDNDLDSTYVETDHSHTGGTPDRSVPIIITPLGVMPLKSTNDPTRIFSFYLCEVNFSITPRIAKVLSELPGIEILDVFTRYKFRIAIGNNFKFKDVKKSIEQALLISPAKDTKLDKVLDGQVKELIENQLSKSTYWAIYILPNGEMDSVTSNIDDSDSFNNMLNVYNKSKEMVGGTLYTSSDL
jgi:hypothetical protein